MGINFRQIGDSFQSLLTGLGVYGRDKTSGMRAMLQPWERLTWDKYGLDSLYRTNWLARKITDIPAFDATRAWRSWTGTQDQIEALQKTEKAFGMQRKMLSAMTKARLYGGACIIIGCNDGTFETELNLDKVGKGDLKFVHVVEKWMIGAGPRVRDITSPWFGEPNYYMRSNIPIVEAPGGVTPLLGESSAFINNRSDAIYIHPSRVVRLVGLDYPDIEMAEDAWGDSCLQPIYQALRDAGLVSGSLANTIADSKVDVFKIPGLIATLSTQAGTTQLMNYLTNANTAKSVLNALVMDKDFDWDRIETHYEGMPKVLEMFLLICAAAGDIPSTRLLSREPAGMNSTGDSDTRNYYDRLHADQTVRITPIMTRLDEVLIRTTFGTRDPAITYEWNSLWQQSDDEKAGTALKKAQAFQIDANSGLIPPAALAIGRQNQLIQDGTYPGLDQALDDWQDEQDLAELNDPTPQPGDPDYQDPNKPDADNDNDEDSDSSSSGNTVHLKISKADEDTGHPFRGNQYATGESGGGATKPQGNRPRGMVKQLRNGRVVHANYALYARAAKLMARKRSRAEHAAAQAAIREAYYKHGAEAKRFAEEPLSYKIMDTVAHQFASMHQDIVKGWSAPHKLEAAGSFLEKQTVGFFHELAVEHVLLPVIESAMVAGLAEFGVGEAAPAAIAGVEIVHYAVKRIVEHSPLGPEHALELLRHTTHALMIGWHAATQHSHDGLTDADNYANMIAALGRFNDALTQYSELSTEETSP
ncbi:MAG TPA: DUF1073 domain-containing protein [Candidatus Saccharimonadales bacterium]|nr:DUF1073 domain-containing protein [Candidatus Saccharimonadales bacterium]